MNIQDEVSKIHAQFGVSELANYKIQILCENYGKEQYNKAIDDAFTASGRTRGYYCVEQILKLKKDVSKSELNCL